MNPPSVDLATDSPRRGPGRPRGGQLLADRDQLLAAALRVIRADGPDVTMADIAAEATVSKPILYRTIGDKEALATALSESLIDRINAAVTETMVAGSGPRAEFEAAIRGYLTAVDADRNVFLFVNAGGPSTDQFRRLVDRSASGLIELFAAARVEAGLDEATATTWAYAIIGAFQVVTLMWLRDEYCELDEVAQQLTELMWPGVAAVAERG